jgi:hypothetical protein
MLVEAHCKGNGGTASSWQNAAVVDQRDGAVWRTLGAGAKEAGDDEFMSALRDDDAPDC